MAHGVGEPGTRRQAGREHTAERIARADRVDGVDDVWPGRRCRRRASTRRPPGRRASPPCCGRRSPPASCAAAAARSAAATGEQRQLGLVRHDDVDQARRTLRVGDRRRRVEDRRWRRHGARPPRPRPRRRQAARAGRAPRLARPIRSQPIEVGDRRRWLARGTMMIEFSPLSSTTGKAIPVPAPAMRAHAGGVDALGRRAARRTGGRARRRRAPPTIDVVAPARAAATAWLKPLPPRKVSQLVPITVSPRSGRRGARTTMSAMKLPTTQTSTSGPSAAVSTTGDRPAAEAATERPRRVAAVEVRGSELAGDHQRRSPSASPITMAAVVDALGTMSCGSPSRSTPTWMCVVASGGQSWTCPAAGHRDHRDAAWPRRARRRRRPRRSRRCWRWR